MRSEEHQDYEKKATLFFNVFLNIIISSSSPRCVNYEYLKYSIIDVLLIFLYLLLDLKSLITLQI